MSRLDAIVMYQIGCSTPEFKDGVGDFITEDDIKQWHLISNTELLSESLVSKYMSDIEYFILCRWIIKLK